jgi:ankyrin repeat protein
MLPENAGNKQGSRPIQYNTIHFYTLLHAIVTKNLSYFSSSEVCLFGTHLLSRILKILNIGARADTLNKELLTPFHASIKAGNTPVVRFIMERRGRSFNGYHPSKAAPSGKTPLQLAIESDVASVVELVVKDATTHDVARCWKMECMAEGIREILRTKVGTHGFSH